MLYNRGMGRDKAIIWIALALLPDDQEHTQRFGGVDLISAERAHVVDFLAPIVSAETRASKRSALSSFYTWTIVTGRRELANPCDSVVPLPRPPGVPRPCPDVITNAALVDAAPDQYAAIVLARFAGLRAGEVAAVRRGDLLDGRLHVVGKGDRRRVVPAHPLVVKIVESVHGYVFSDGGRSHWRSGTITGKVSAALPAGWTCHTLRHAFGTEVYRESGGDLLLTQELLGHASPATTRRYVLVNDARKADVISRIGGGVAAVQAAA